MEYSLGNNICPIACPADICGMSGTGLRGPLCCASPQLTIEEALTEYFKFPFQSTVRNSTFPIVPN